MTTRTVVVLIGAGSAVFTQGLVADFILSEDLGPIELRLVDIHEETLLAVAKIVSQMVSVKQADITVRWSTERRDMLPGAHVVVTTIAVGGRRAWEQDVLIPRNHGIYQPVGDTTMSGGISRALRMIPVMLDIARDVKELAPDAWFFNYSNPMTPICSAIHRTLQVSVVGLCHGVTHVENYLARFLGVEPKRISSFGAGLNHLTFLYDLRIDGQDAWPEVHRVLEQQRTSLQEHGYDGELVGNMSRSTNSELFYGEPFSWDLYERYGAFPAVLDRHVTEFFPERFANGAYFGKTLGVDAFKIQAVIARGDEEYQEMLIRSRTGTINERLFERTSGEHEKLVEILVSLKQDRKQVFYVNMPNMGAVPGLPIDAVLEMPAAATGRGFRALLQPDFPRILTGILNRRLSVIDLTAEAAITGNRQMFVEALLADGSVHGQQRAEALADDLLTAHRAYLPQFT
ncbi:MAG: hypothetical protein K6T83_03420 [Alicyclobacillus sp.]|nr:hypothetical protein [Alicyclobacillus sp.]